MHLLKSLAAFAAFATFTMATDEAPVPPQMTLLYSMEALLGERFSLGPIPTGNERIVIPIIGGTFKGPRLNGTSSMSCLSLRFGWDGYCVFATHYPRFDFPASLHSPKLATCKHHRHSLESHLG